MSRPDKPKWRYIALRLQAPTPISRRGFGNALKGQVRKAELDPPPELTRFEWPHAIVRADHTNHLEARKMLAGMTWAIEAAAKVPLQVETLSTSGTIRRVTKRVRFLQERGPAAGGSKSPGKGKDSRDKPKGPRRSPVAGGPAAPPGRTRGYVAPPGRATRRQG
ncbi:MAG: hypothetical protein ACPGQL_07685 [Thermoplasmatota archaeon]